MKKVLVIDDEKGIRALVRAALKPSFEIAEAEDGASGYELALTTAPHLILCDVHMAEMDGYATLAKLRDHPNTRTTPFIFLTGSAAPHDVRHGMNLGADDFLPKPFAFEALRAAVNARLWKHEQTQAEMNARVQRLQHSIAATLPNELLGPMDNLLGLTELIGKGYREFDGDEIIAMSRDAHKAAVRMRQQLENCLLYAELLVSAHDPAPVPARSPLAPTCVSDLVEITAVEYARQFGRARDLQIVSSFCEASLPEHDVRKIVQELLDNALKAAPPQSRITLTVRPNGTSIAIEIQDSGPGIAPEHITALDAFMRFEQKMVTGRGCGLGLAIAKRLTERAGGTLGIESRQGTKVTVTLPMTLARLN